MTSHRDSCEMVEGLIAEIFERVGAEAPEEEIRQAVRDAGAELVSRVRGRGLTALAENARDVFNSTGTDYTIHYEGQYMVIHVHDCPVRNHPDSAFAPNCRFASILMDEICRWAGFHVEFETARDGPNCVQRYRPEDTLPE